MLYLLWSLLNIALFLYFIIICFKATKLLREKVGLLASIIFVAGSLSFIGQSNIDNDNKEPNSNQIRTWKFHSADTLNKNATFSLDVILEKTLVSKYNLGIKYGKNQEQFNIPISAYTMTTGFSSGTNWKPITIVVNRTADNNKFEYMVTGMVEWKLLGATLYSQLKEYKGIASTR